jgi:hypothetical protein
LGVIPAKTRLTFCLCTLLLPLTACGHGRGASPGQVDQPAPSGRQASRAEWTFDDLTPGPVPPGWRIAATNPTAAIATWQVLGDPTAPSPPNVLALTDSENYDGTFNLAIAAGPSLGDLELSVLAKAVAGREDQGGGPIWRCQDENNYYICRFNPLESDFRLYVVADGKRRQLDSGRIELRADRWYEVRIRMVGDRITCWLDGQQLLQAADSTIQRAGRVGLWTKADAATSFDSVQARALSTGE